MSHLDEDPTKEPSHHRRMPCCTDYIETHDKNWDRDVREAWKIKSDESMQHIQAKYRPVTAPDGPQSTESSKWYKVPTYKK